MRHDTRTDGRRHPPSAAPEREQRQRWLEAAARDLGFAARTLRRAPAFTLVVIASLALGLAVASTTLTIVNAYLIRSLPYPGANRLYAVMYSPPGQPEPGGMSAIDWLSLDGVVESAATSLGQTFYLSDGGAAALARGLRVSGGFVDSLGLRLAIGRGFTPEEFQPGAEGVALIGHRIWRERFGADPAIVGRQLRASVDGERGSTPASLRIVGVLPPVFWYQYNRDSPDIVVPLREAARTYMIRVCDGVPVADAERRITMEARRVGSGIPPNWTGVRLESVHKRYAADLRPLLTSIMIATALVLVLVCANVAILILLRTLRRQKEIGVRLALGAGRTQIVRMLAAEIALLCGAALAAGLGVTALAVRALAPYVEARFERPAPGGLSAAMLDPTVLLALAGVGVLISASLALIPLHPAWQRRLGDNLRIESRGSTEGRPARRLQAALIAFEVCVALVLLVAGGVMVRSIVNLVRTDLGFTTARIGYAHMVLPPRNYASPAALVSFYDRLATRLPGAASIGLVDFIPFAETLKQPVAMEGGTGAAETAGVLAVNDGYFSTLDIGVVQGRGVSPADRIEAEPIAILSATLAWRLWPNASPIGQHVRIGTATAGAPPPVRTVVGVVRDVRQTYADTDLREVYVPFAQAPSRFTSLYARTDQPVAMWLSQVRQAIAGTDPYVIVNASGTLAGEDRQLAGTSFLASTLTVSAAFGAFIALLGIYGVTAYTAQQRRREVAIRLALGASGTAIVRMFLKEACLVLAAGLGCGLGGAILMARVLEHQVQGVTPFDPVTLLVSAALLTFTGLLVSWLPARRAATITPGSTLNEG